MGTSGEVVVHWLAGEDRHLVAPFAPPSEFLAEDARALAVLGSDLSAIAWASATGAGLLIRTSPRAARRSCLGASGPRLVATSVDSLHSPVLRREVASSLPGVPWLVWDADGMSSLHPGHAGRAEWVPVHRRACGGGAILWRHADRRMAPPEAPCAAGATGTLRLVARCDVASLVQAGRGIATGEAAISESFARLLGEGGRARRVHDLRRLQHRAFQQAERALREEVQGIDAFRDDTGLVPGRLLVRTSGPVLPSDCAVSRGAALGQVAWGPGPTPVLAASDVDRCREALSASWTGDLLAVPGDLAGIGAELMGDLQATGVLVALRPARLAARVSDQHRFRPPRADLEPEYRALYDAYTVATSRWSLAERARLALTDRATADLRGLAAALRVDPAAIADLLVTMDDDGLMTAFCEPLGGDVDWQALRGPRWGAPADELARDIASLRAARGEAIEMAAAIWRAASGCRSKLLADACGVDVCEPCGRCDLCDPPGSEWPRTLTGPGPAPATVTLTLVPPKRSAPALDSLFAGLGGAPPVAAPAPARLTDADLAAALRSGEPGRAGEALREAGSAAMLWLRAGWEPGGPGRVAQPTQDVADVVVSWLTVESGPTPAAPQPGARRTGPKGLEVRPRGPGAAWRWSELPDCWELLEKAAALEAPAGALAQLVATRRHREAWTGWCEAAGARLAGWLDANPGIPGPGDLLPAAPRWEGSSAWGDALAALDAADRGDVESALDRLPDIPGSELPEALLLAALGDWAALWDSAAGSLGQARGADSPLDRLEARALLALEPVPKVAASVALAWLDLMGREPAKPQARAERLVEAIERGRPAEFLALAVRIDPAAPARRAMALAALPEELLAHVLDPADPIPALAALAAPPSRLRAIWAEHVGGKPLAEQRVLVDRLGDRAPALAAAGEAHLEALEQTEARRVQIARLADEGRLAEIVPLLAGLDAESMGLGGVAERVAAAQRRYTEPLAAAMAGSQHDEDAWAALRCAGAQGWLDSLMVLLRGQARRHPEDQRRALWLARALVVAGRWAEAERQYGEAAGLAPGLVEAAQCEMEGIDLALGAGQAGRASDWLVRLLRTRRDRAVAREITVRVWGDRFPEQVASALRNEIERDGGGLFASALLALQDPRRRR